MKTQLLITAITINILLSTFNLFSQSPCLPEGITFTTQEQIDNFMINYPGCTEIEGNVSIEGNDIENLYGLSVLTSIGGNLRIDDNYYALTSLMGLDNITAIGGGLTISWNWLHDFSGLENLSSIGGELEIWMQFRLNDLILESLTSVGGGIKIHSNSSPGSTATFACQLGNLNFIGGDLLIYSNPDMLYFEMESSAYIGGDLSVYGNEQITYCSFESSTALEGNLAIYDNEQLTAFTGDWLCNYLTSPNGTIDIYENGPGFEDLMEVGIACGGNLPCLPYGNYHFYKQAHVNNFPLAFPGCTALNGVVEISGPILNLNGLTEVTSIGSLVIEGNQNLHNLIGLEQLTTIQEDLIIQDNYSLYDLTELEQLTSIGRDLIVMDNEYLYDIAALEGINSITGNVVISGNTHLVNLNGLENFLTIDGNFEIESNEVLDNISALDGLTSVDGNLVVSSNPVLNSLNGLNSLQSIGGNLEIVENDTLINLGGLESLTSIDSSLNIYGNDKLVSISGLENVTYIHGNVQIGKNGDYYPGWDHIGNPKLKNLSGLDNLDSIGGSLNIHSNHSLHDLSGLENLQSIGGGLDVSINDSIINLSGLENLNSIGGFLNICGNEQLKTLTGLENINHIPGHVTIGYQDYWGGAWNQSLESLSGLNNLDSIGGSLRIVGATILSDLTGLANLKTIGGDLVLGFHNDQAYWPCGSGNHALTNLHGLENLTSINGKLGIICNEGLTSLSGLDNIAANSIQELSIRFNESLSHCAVQSVCNYLLAPNGTTYISSNAPGCNSPEEVQDSCDVIRQVNELLGEGTFTISPNPFAEALAISYHLPESSPVSITIHDFSGRLISTLVNEDQKQGAQMLFYETAGLAPGVYFCTLKTDEGVQTTKIIKL